MIKNKMIFKKGQVPSQMIGMIMTLLIISAILIIGFKLIIGLTNKTESLNSIYFEEELKSAFKEAKSDYMSVKKISLSMPSGANEFCLFDLNKKIDFDGMNQAQIELKEEIKKNNPIVFNYWSDFQNILGSTSRNAFLIGKSSFSTFYLDSLVIDSKDSDSNYLCFKEKNSKIEFYIQGLGKSVKVYES
jgi:hypothetical protein